MTVEKDIELALLTRAEYVHGLVAPSLPVSWPNKSFTPPSDGSPYLEVRILPNQNLRPFLGSAEPSYRQGILQFNYLSPYDAGPSSGTELAGQIALGFPADFVMREGGVKVQVQRTPDVGTAVPNPNGTKWLVPVSVYYEVFA